jgi:hypothetical protein
VEVTKVGKVGELTVRLPFRPVNTFLCFYWFHTVVIGVTTSTRACLQAAKTMRGNLPKVCTPPLRLIVKVKRCLTRCVGFQLHTVACACVRACVRRPEFVGNPKLPSLHGGVAAALLDHTAGFTAWTALPDVEHRLSTVNIRIDYLAPATCTNLVAGC